MTNLTKILIGTAVVAGVSAIVAVVSDKEEEVTLVRKTDEKGNVVIEPQVKEEKSLLKRIKEYVTKKVIKILAFVALHSEQIEAVSTLIGLGSGIIAITGAIRDFKRGNDMQDQIDEINEKIDVLLNQEVLTNKAMNHNNLVFAAVSEEISKKVGVDMHDLDAKLSAIA